MKKVLFLFSFILICSIAANAKSFEFNYSDYFISPPPPTLHTASTSYNIYYLSGTASVQYGNTTYPNYVLSSITVYCTQYGGNLPIIQFISHGTSPGGLYDDHFLATTPDGVYNVYFMITGTTNGTSANIQVTDTEYIPA